MKPNIEEARAMTDKDYESKRAGAIARILVNTMSNVYEIAKHPPIDDLSELFSDRRVLIVGPGPSYNLDIIKRAYEKVPIIALNAAIGYMVNDGLRPTLGLCIDSSIEPANVPTDIPMMLAWNVKPGMFARDTAFTFSCSIYMDRGLWPLYPKVSKILPGSTVTSTALMICKKLGAKKVYIHGCDLGYSEDGKQYANDINDPGFVYQYEKAAIFIEAMREIIMPEVECFKWGGHRQLEGFKTAMDFELSLMDAMPAVEFEKRVKEIHGRYKPFTIDKSRKEIAEDCKSRLELIGIKFNYKTSEEYAAELKKTS